jgi:SET domain-containing protein
MPRRKALPFTLRRSAIAGTGAFANRPIAKGTRIVEYVGERISHEEADRRYSDEGEHPHVVLFIADRRTVIDAGVRGNEARFINHSCDPNCEVVIERGRVFIDAARDIGPGEELSYDYSLSRDGDEDAEDEARYACHCGAPECRGTMLEPRPRRRRGNRRTR